MKVKIVVFNDGDEADSWEFEEGDGNVSVWPLEPGQYQELFFSKGDQMVVRREEDGEVTVKSSGGFDPTYEGVWPECCRQRLLEEAEAAEEES